MAFTVSSESLLSYLFELLYLSDPKMFLCFLSTDFLLDLKSKQTYFQHQVCIFTITSYYKRISRTGVGLLSIFYHLYIKIL